jgi:hypothetical protein
MSLEDALKRVQSWSAGAPPVPQPPPVDYVAKQQGELDAIIRPCVLAINAAKQHDIAQFIRENRKELRNSSQAKPLHLLNDPRFSAGPASVHGILEVWGPVSRKTTPYAEMKLSRSHSTAVSVSFRADPALSGDWISVACTFDMNRANGYFSTTHDFKPGQRKKMDDAAHRYLLEALPEVFAVYLDYFRIPFPRI